METGKEEKIHNYPTPERLWDMIHGNITDWESKFNAVPYETFAGTKPLRYYQKNAVNNVLKAIANGEQRLLLTLATGTGKTYIAFQIAWKLFNARWNNRDAKDQRPRVLFLADRNILADQAYNSFSAFAEDALVRMNTNQWFTWTDSKNKIYANLRLTDKIGVDGNIVDNTVTELPTESAVNAKLKELQDAWDAANG